jgi:molecular chaperone IbpA|tara:strand:+ start:347 stop:826 length:480 start_codon:yes stop_codon:yes gene_type:complete
MTGNFAYPRNAFLGFDHIFDQLESIHLGSKDTYPPHNVVKNSDMQYEVELAVAGFNEDHIDIEVKDHVLKITGNRPQRREQEMYIHKGISARKFKRSFRLSEYTEVTGAQMKDGILTVTLEVILPEEKRPRKIKINSNEVNNHDSTSSQLLNEGVQLNA